jgi:hypothetical protein
MDLSRPTTPEQHDRLAERVSAGAYGTVLIIAALLVVEEESITSGVGWQLAAGVGAATWLAHLYAEVLGNHVRRVDATESHEVRKAMVDGLPILLAAVLPALALGLGSVEALAPRQALWIAVIVSIVQLVAIGAYVGVVAEQRSTSWRYAAVAAAFGLGVVLLLVALGH